MKYQGWLPKNHPANPTRDILSAAQTVNITGSNIHSNPVVAGLCQFPEKYKYFFASFYIIVDTTLSFLTHYNA